MRTGNREVDAVSRAGLIGLTGTLNRRTAVETAEPLAVDIESDELIFFPLLYWPVTAEQAPPSPRAVERINRYLETGGTILFDTRDAGAATPGPFGSAAASQATLRRLTGAIKIPPLVPVPPDHVLTKSFYLLHEFPGRWNSGQVWVEQVEDRVNDGVASVIVGGNDWAGAWAVDEQGRPAFPCVPGRRAAARDGDAVRGQPRHVRADRQLQERPGARAGDPRTARPVTQRLLRLPSVRNRIAASAAATHSGRCISPAEVSAMITADLTGKTALVTGGASGIGLATVEIFARSGATVALNHLPDDPRGAEQVARLTAEGHRVVAAPGNVARPGEAEDTVTRAIDALGRLDFLVNNAGTPATPAPIPFAELDRLTEDFWQTILNTNLIGPFRCTHAAVGALRQARGAICSTASIAGVQGSGSSIPYATSKAGVINLTRSLARTLAPEIRVNAVAPGFVDSPWNREWPADRKAQSVERTPLKRACKPEDIAETIFFLCAGAAMITGQTIIVDGGLTL